MRCKTNFAIILMGLISLSIFCSFGKSTDADMSNVTGVKIGDIFTFNETYTGNQSPVGSYVRSYNITSMENSSGDAKLYCKITLNNLTSSEITNNSQYEYVYKDRTTTNQNLDYFINKNIANKSYNSGYVNSPGKQYWYNATWDENGVLETYNAWDWPDILGLRTITIVRITSNDLLGSDPGNNSDEGTIPGFPLEFLGLTSILFIFSLIKKKQH